MNRQLLEQPFSKDEIKQREGSHGKTLDYIEGCSIIQRLNDAFEGLWSFEIVLHEIFQDEVMVLGRLTAEGVVKTQFGSARVKRSRETKEPISVADDLKSASTDSLKKCATLFGVGLHLYVSRNDDAGPGQSQRPSSNGQKPDNGAGSNGGSGNGTNGNGRLSGKQHSFLMRLANEKGITRRELNDRCLDSYGAVVGYLTRNDASQLIETMLAQ